VLGKNRPPVVIASEAWQSRKLIYKLVDNTRPPATLHTGRIILKKKKVKTLLDFHLLSLYFPTNIFLVTLLIIACLFVRTLFVF